jgi:hypothetical protein
MKLSEIQGKNNPEYNDVEIRLLIKDSKKLAWMIVPPFGT